MDQHQIDFNALLDALLPFAEQMLCKHGEFHPFGGMMKTDSEIGFAAAHDDKDATQSTDLIEMMKSAFRSDAKVGSIRASAIVYDTRIQRPDMGIVSDAIAIELDHANSSSLVAYIPYTLNNGAPSFGEMIFDAGEGRIFAS